MAGATNCWDVIVVGAGPAGSSAAFFAARAGLHTLLLERARFPRDKICGDGLGASSVAMLKQMGIYEKVLARGALAGAGLSVGGPGGGLFQGRGIFRESPFEPKEGLVVPRLVLDEVCARAAVQAGAHLREEAAVETLHWSDGQLAGVRLASGELITGRIVIGADGVYSRVARAIGQSNAQGKHTAGAVRVYYENVEPFGDEICLIYDKRFLPGYFWIFPLPNGRANVGLGRFDRFTRPGDPSLKELFDRFAAENPLARRLLGKGRAQGKLRGWPLRLGLSARSGVADGVLLVGDANGFVDPLTGEGIRFALRSGQLAAETAATALRDGDTTKERLSEYEKRWRAEFSREFRSANLALDVLITRPGVIDALVDLGNARRDLAVLLSDVVRGARPKADLLTARVLSRVALRYFARKLTRPGSRPRDEAASGGHQSAPRIDNRP